MRRTELKNAPYNPRVITRQARSNLRGILKKLGLLDGPVWNKRTGNVVGGHQRLSELDHAAGSENYLLTVNEVDLSPDEEEQANIALNNWRAHGSFDSEKLQGMLAKHQANLEATGFTTANMMSMFGGQLDKLETEQLQKAADKLRAARAAVDEMRERSLKRDAPDYYLVLVFPAVDDCEEFCDALGLELERFQNGRLLREAIEELASRPSLSGGRAETGRAPGRPVAG